MSRTSMSRTNTAIAGAAIAVTLNLSGAFSNTASGAEKPSSNNARLVQKNVKIAPEFSETGHFIGQITTAGTDYYVPINMDYLEPKSGGITVGFVAGNFINDGCGVLKGHVKKLGFWSTNTEHVNIVTGHVGGHGTDAGDIQANNNYALIRWLRENRAADYERLMEQNKFIKKFDMNMRDAVEYYDTLFEGYHEIYLGLTEEPTNEATHDHAGHNHDH